MHVAGYTSQLMLCANAGWGTGLRYGPDELGPWVKKSGRYHP
jgi:hypothetical protein